MVHKPLPLLDSATTARFWSYVERASGDKCWIWQNALDKGGYGKFSIGRSPYRAHRMAYWLHYGVDPSDLLVCHSCDNPSCCNPAHLFLGTHQENILDARNKGRLKPRSGDENGSHTHPEAVMRGEQKPDSKLTEDQAREIRRLYADERLNQQQIADRFGVTREAVSRIIVGKNWRHVVRENETLSLSDSLRHGKPGEQNHNVKLTESDVRLIRQIYATHAYTLEALAVRFHVSKPSIWQIVQRRSWKHIH